MEPFSRVISIHCTVCKIGGTRLRRRNPLAARDICSLNRCVNVIITKVALHFHFDLTGWKIVCRGYLNLVCTGNKTVIRFSTKKNILKVLRRCVTTHYYATNYTNLPIAVFRPISTEIRHVTRTSSLPPQQIECSIDNLTPVGTKFVVNDVVLRVEKCNEHTVLTFDHFCCLTFVIGFKKCLCSSNASTITEKVSKEHFFFFKSHTKLPPASLFHPINLNEDE